MDLANSSTDDENLIEHKVLILSESDDQTTTTNIINQAEQIKQSKKQNNKRYRANKKIKTQSLEEQDKIRQRSRKYSKTYRDRRKMEKNVLSQQHSNEEIRPSTCRQKNISSSDKRKARNKRYQDKIKLQKQQQLLHISSVPVTSTIDDKERSKQLRKERNKRYNEKRKNKKQTKLLNQQNSNKESSKIHFSDAQANNLSSDNGQQETSQVLSTSSYTGRFRIYIRTDLYRTRHMAWPQSAN